ATDKITHTGVNIKSEILAGIKEYELVKNSNQFKTNNPKIAQETLYGFFPSSLFLSDITAGTKNIKSTITPIKIKNNKEIEMIIPPLYFTKWPVCLRIAFTYLFAKIVNSQGIFSLFQPRCSSNFCILKPELITEFMISLSV